MATRQLLTALTAAHTQNGGPQVQLESVGGVDAARRVRAGEAFDFVCLASDALQRLVEEGWVSAPSCAGLVHSDVALAVRAGAPRADVGSEAALRALVLQSPSIGYSTGPSGTALLALIARWGLTEALQGRLQQAPPGVPVGSMVANGTVALGFQQLSELMHLPGLELLGTLPAPVQIRTTFSLGACTRSAQADAVRTMLDFMNAPWADSVKRAHGMEPIA